jgi:hypothetical protein
LLGDVVFTVEVDVLSQAGTAVESAHCHAALEDEATGTLPHQQSGELHLGSISKLCLRTETQVMGAENHI